MPQETVKRILNEAQDPRGSYEPVSLDLYRGVETRPTEHVIRVTEDDEAHESIAVEYLYAAASFSGYSVADETDGEDQPVYRLTASD